MKYPYSKGDILIDRRTLKKFLIEEVKDGRVLFDSGMKRAVGQVIKHRRAFKHIRVGETLDEELVFFCPIKNTMVVLNKGTTYLGKL